MTVSTQLNYFDTRRRVEHSDSLNRNIVGSMAPIRHRRTGRPRGPQRRIVAAAMDADRADLIFATCDELGITISDAIRNGLEVFLQTHADPAELARVTRHSPEELPLTG